jgi:hypothetical protein
VVLRLVTVDTLEVSTPVATTHCGLLKKYPKIDAMPPAPPTVAVIVSNIQINNSFINKE